MSDFPKKAEDNVNSLAIVAIGLATAALLWASVLALQAYFMNTEGEIAAQRAQDGRSIVVRDLKAKHRASLSRTTYADSKKGTLKRLDIQYAMDAVIRDAQGGKNTWIPTLGLLNVPTINLAGNSLEEKPKEKTVAPAAPKPDRDGDSVSDDIDNCPDEAGTVEFLGCKEPQLVKISETGTIEILDKVFFKTNKAVILKTSFGLLDNVAQVVSNHTEIAHIRVEGHTDNQGQAAPNKVLSQKRADAVMAYLVKKGVEKGRLVAVGYGDVKPIQSNETEEGRTANRRVDFVVIKEEAAVVPVPETPVAPVPAPKPTPAP